MNFSFYIFGTPSGYNQYPADSNNSEFQEFVQSSTTESQLTVKRSGLLVYYVYMRRLQEKSSSFLGFCLVFNSVYCRNPKKLFELFDRAYYDVQLKGEFIKFDQLKVNFVISKFGEKSFEIERIKTFFKNNLESDFTHDFTQLSPEFKFGNGYKNISIKENDIDILATISEYEVVHISKNEKSISELERTQKILTDLWAEKHALQQDFNKLLAKKKQYSVVIVLCFILIGCGVGLFVFNRNLQNRDDKIQSLNTEIYNKNQEVSNKQSEISKLNITQTNMINQINTFSEIKKNNDSIIDAIVYKIYYLKSLDSLMNIEDSLSFNPFIDTSYQKLQYIVSEIDNFGHKMYKINVTKSYCYENCEGEYNLTKCFFYLGEVVNVYIQQDGYGLTNQGYVKLSELERY